MSDKNFTIYRLKLRKRFFKLYEVSQIPENILPMSIHWLGNSSVATIPTLFDLVRKGELKEHTSLLDRLEDEKREAEKQAMTSGHLLKQLDGEMTRVRERISVSERELQRLASERAEQEELITLRHAEVTAVVQSRLQLELQLAAGQDRLTELRQSRDVCLECM